MPTVRTAAVILHSFPYGESSRILRLLTPDFGVRSVIAKGAQRPKSRFGGILEPFTEGEAQFNLREGRDLFTLSGFTLSRSRQAIGRDLGAFTGASMIAELVLRFATDEPQPDLYSAVIGTFDRLAAHDTDPVGTSLAAIWMIVSLFGFQPRMDSCIRCGRSFESDEPSRFDLEAGGSVCLACRPAGRIMPSATRQQIFAMSAGLPIRQPVQDRHLHASFLQAFLAAHVFHGRPLRSLPLYLEQLR